MTAKQLQETLVPFVAPTNKSKKEAALEQAVAKRRLRHKQYVDRLKVSLHLQPWGLCRILFSIVFHINNTALY